MTLSRQGPKDALKVVAFFILAVGVILMRKLILKY